MQSVFQSHEYWIHQFFHSINEKSRINYHLIFLFLFFFSIMKHPFDVCAPGKIDKIFCSLNECSNVLGSICQLLCSTVDKRLTQHIHHPSEFTWQRACVRNRLALKKYRKIGRRRCFDRKHTHSRLRLMAFFRLDCECMGGGSAFYAA